MKGQCMDKILGQITCDEKWIYFNNTGRKGCWSVPGEAVSSVVKCNLTTKKIMFCV
ncbi:hypothetical protein X975_24891, partial [Stegodyphus mimosarum]